MISSRLLASIIGSGVLASILILAAPVTTHANPIDQPPTATVRLRDLNLDTRAGTEAVYRRIEIAAVDVCQETAPRGSLLASRAHQFCLRNAVAGAVRAVDSPALTAYFAQRDSRAIGESQVRNTTSR